MGETIAFDSGEPTITAADVRGSLTHGIAASVLSQYRSQEFTDNNHTTQSVPVCIPCSAQTNSEKIKKFWMHKLLGSSSVPFPPRPSWEYQPRANSIFIAEALKIQSHKSVTLASIIRASWALVVAQYSETNDVVFGSMETERSLDVSDMETMGPTMFTSPFRVQIDRKATIQGFLSKVQNDYAETIPFEKVGLQHIQRFNDDCQNACGFQNLLVLQEDSTRSMEMTNVEQPKQGLLEYSIVNECNIGRDGISIRILHDSNTISRQRVQWIVEQFKHVIEQLNSLEGLVADVNLFSPKDKQMVLKWNAAFPKTIEKLIHQVIEEKVWQQPDAEAIVSWDQNLSYSGLDEVSTRVANYLIAELGVVPGQIIPLCFEKSAWTIVAILGVLKAGGAFVALDPSQPSLRLKEIIDEVDSTLILCSAQHYALAASFGKGVFTISSTFVNSLDASKPTVQTNVVASDPAYVIFTSGTTGKPKGVLITHEAFCSGAACHGRAMLQAKSSRVLQFASYSFDACLVEILTPLMHGACVCIASEESRLNSLSEVMNEMQVTWAVLTPSLARTLSPGDLKTLTTLVLAGEAMSKDDVNRWARKIKLVNGYGPSECSVVAAVNSNVNTVNEVGNIGQSVATLCWIVNPENHNQLTPLGCVGELLIEGPTLARGYLNMDQATANSFIYEPHWASKSENGKLRRFYKTGDLVSYNDDGSLRYIGRKDSQVKIRGQRIELGEIEHAIQRISTIKAECFVEVFVPNTKKQGQQLIAFLCLDENGTVPRILPPSDDTRKSILKLRKGLERYLPRYMIPLYFIPLSLVPRSRSGKVDRMILREIAKGLTQTDLWKGSLENPARSEPSTDMQRQLRALWADVLGLDMCSIGADDNFTNLNGDSISAIYLVEKSRKAGIRLKVSNIFKNPVLSNMARVAEYLVGSLQDEQTVKPFSAIKTLGSISTSISEAAKQCDIDESHIKDIYPCTPLQVGMMSLTARDPRVYTSRNVFKLPMKVDLTRFRMAWETIYRMAEILRTRIVHSEDLQYNQVVVSDTLDWEYASDLQRYIEDDEKRRMNYGSPLCRFAMIHQSSNCQFFVWTVHHALFDGWSMARMFEIVQTAYDKGPLSSTPPFSSFVNYVSSTDVESSDQYWRTAFLEMRPAKFPQLPSTSYQPCAKAVFKDPIKASIRQEKDFRVSTIIRAAWALVLNRYTNSDDIVFGEVLSGRDVPVPNITEILGPTIASVPVGITVRPSEKVREYLSRVQVQSEHIRRFAHTGLQRIRHLSSPNEEACNFQNLLILQSAIADKETVPLDMERASLTYKGFMSYAMVLRCSFDKNKVEIAVEYDPEIMNEERVERIVKQFRYTMEQISLQINEHVESIDLISPEEEILLHSWNDSIPAPLESCMHDMFALQVQQRPNSIAACWTNGCITYRELDDYASRLAHYLRFLGVFPEVFVAISFEKSVWAIVAMLGVMKVGGAFVALDPSHPRNRLETIISDTKATVIVTSALHASKFNGLLQQIVIVDTTLMTSIGRDCDLIPPLTHPRNAVYAVFTSGSTGKPKGIIVEHQALCTSTKRQGSVMGLGPHSRVLQFSAYTFDVSYGDIFATFLYGGCVCIPSDTERLEDLAGVMERLHVTTACLTPTVVSLITPTTVPSLKTLSLGGEPLLQEHLTTWGEAVQLINIYGPSECTVWSAAFTGMSPLTHPSNIGKGFSSTFWITDMSNPDKLSPIGCAGEILIEGHVLARGYLNDEAKTSAAFIEAPKWTRNSTARTSAKRRFYRTGDLGRYNTDGTISLLGRNDNQVKIRGQRIELGEIEQHIGCGKGITHVVVDLPSSGPFNRTLVAVVSLDRNSNLTSKKLKLIDPLEIHSSKARIIATSENLVKALPSYMLPQHWVFVEGFPLLASGKIDRRGVKEWLQLFHDATYNKVRKIQSELHGSQISYLDDSEDLALTLWTKITQLAARRGDKLNLCKPQNLMLHSCGLDSISSVPLETFVRKSYGVHIPIATLLSDNITIRDIAKLILDMGSTGLSTSLSRTDLMAEYHLLERQLSETPVIRSQSMLKAQDRPATVFLTGGTGFLGSEILRQLLKRRHVQKVVLLVRADTMKSAKEKIRRCGNIGGWWREELESKLEIWLGDLTKPRFGLSGTQWKRLSGDVDHIQDSVCAIIHNGAVVHWAMNYARLKAANVSSTMELISACLASRLPPKLTFVSGGHMLANDEEDSKAAMRLSQANGYAQSKFVSELLVKSYIQILAAANQDTHGIHIVKPGLIVGNSESGVSNLDDYLWRVVYAAVKVKAYNKSEEASWIMVRGADSVAHAVLETCFGEEKDDRFLRLVDGITVGDFWDLVKQHFILRPIGAEEWLQLVQNDVEETGQSHPLYPVLHFLRESSGYIGGAVPRCFQSGAQNDDVKSAISESLAYLKRINYFSEDFSADRIESEAQLVFRRSKNYSRPMR